MHKTVQITHCGKVFCVTAYPCVSTSVPWTYVWAFGFAGCILFANRIVRAASSGDKVQIPWQAWYFVRCAENWRKPRTKHRFWGSKFRGSKENPWQNIGFEATKCQNWRRSRTKCSFWCSHMSRLESLVFLWPRSPCLWGKLQNLSVSKVSKQVVMSFCVAGAGLCDIPTCLIKCRKSFCVAGAALRTPHSTLHTPHSTLYTSHSTLYIPHFTLYTPHPTLYTPHFTLHTLHSTLYTLHFALRTPHSTLYTPHSTLYTLHSTL